jgi:hypothetical protein
MKRRRIKSHKRHVRNERKVDYPFHKLIICSDNYMKAEKKSRTYVDDFKYFVIERHDVEHALFPKYRTIFHSKSRSALKIWLDLHNFDFSNYVTHPLDIDAVEHRMFVAHVVLKERT